MDNAGKTVPALEKIVSLLKQNVAGMSQQTISATIRKHYRILSLLDETDHWTSKRLASISNQLIPESISLANVFSFIDTMGNNLRKDEYLAPFFKSLENAHFSFLVSKYSEEGDSVIPDVMCYAMMLENLSNACADDPQVYQECFQLLSGATARRELFSQLSFFSKVKLLSVEKVVRDSYLASHKNKNVSPKAGKSFVSLNILEATFTDFVQGNTGNAKAGLILARHPCGLKKTDPKTGAGPTVFSQDKKVIEKAYPFPLEWASLYQSWNMCFCTRFPAFPYIISKLFIPSVSGYFEKPKQYIYRRVIALYFTLHFAARFYLSEKRNGRTVMNWRDTQLWMHWGRINEICAHRFSQLGAGGKRQAAAVPPH
jgi:hypothetical protein